MRRVSSRGSASVGTKTSNKLEDNGVPGAITAVCGWATEKIKEGNSSSYGKLRTVPGKVRVGLSVCADLSLEGRRGVFTQRRWNSVLDTLGDKAQVGNINEWGRWE